MNRYNSKNIIYIFLFFIFLVLILTEGYLCKYTKLNFCNESFFLIFGMKMDLSKILAHYSCFLL